jgi:hypothetical protein
MIGTLPTPQRRVATTVEHVWRVPHKDNDARLYNFGLYHHPMRWGFMVKRPGAEDAWPDLGEFLPSVEVFPYIPGVSGEPDPKAPAMFRAAGTGSRRASLEANGWIHLREGDPRLKDEAWYVCTSPGAGGRPLHHCAWDYAEPRGQDVAWHVDDDAYRAFRRIVAGIVPRMTLSAYNAVAEDLAQQRDRKLARASRSDVAAAAYVDAREVAAQAARTWAAYSATDAQPMIRLGSRRVGSVS